MNRIAVVGAIGVGKSVLAQRLGTLLHVRVYDFDELYWRRGRERLQESEWESLLRGILGERRWICDGFPLSVTAEPLELADTVIFLDLPRWTSIVSVFRREVARRLPSRNRSSKRTRMFNALLFEWIWRFPEDHRPDLIQALSRTRSQRVVILRSRREVRRFLSSIGLNVPGGDIFPPPVA